MTAETTSPVQDILDRALRLPAIERAKMVDELLASLDKADPEIDALVLAEAHDRLAAFERGEMAEITEEEFFAELDEP